VLRVPIRQRGTVPRSRLAAALAAGLMSAVLVAGPVAAASQTKTITQSFTGQTDPGVQFDVQGVCDACVDDAIANLFNGTTGAWGFGADASASVTSLAYSASTSTAVTYDDSLLRQGQTLTASDVLTTSGGTITAKGTFTGHYGFYHDTGSGFQPDGTLSAFSKPFTLTIPCAMPLPGDAPATCTSGPVSEGIVSLDVFDVVTNYITIDFSVGFRLDVTITNAGVMTVREAAVTGGGPPQTAPLTFGGTSPSAVGDSFHLSCSEPAGNSVTYGFTDTGYGAGTALGSSIEIDVSAKLWQRLPPPAPDFVVATLASGPVQTVDTPSADVAMPITGSDGSVDLGTLAKNNIPPVVDAGPSPYSGDEGSPIQFDGSGSSSVCGFPTLRWDFSDGGVAFGPHPYHTFTDGGTYSGLLTATDTTGLTSTTTFSIDVANLPPVVSAGPDTTSPWGRPVAFNGSATAPGSDDQATLMYSWDFGDGTPPTAPSGSGGSGVLHAYTTPGDYTATLTVTDEDGLSASASRTVHVIRRTVSVGYLGDTAGTYDTGGALSASLVDQFGAPVNGRTVTFTVDGAPAGSSVTDSSGIAATAYTPLLDAGTYGTAASFAGDTLYVGDTGSGSITIARKGSVTTYTGALKGGPNKTITLSATLVDATGTSLAGRTIEFALGAQTASAVTDTNGIATTSLKLAQKNGAYPITAAWTPSGADANRYLASADSDTFKLQVK
jgi:PKD repeat protein